MLTSMMLHVMYVRDPFLHSMRACMQYNMRHSSQWAPSMQCISVDRLRCNLLVFRPLCKSWLINTQGWLSSILNYKGQKYAITQNILYVSIQSVVYLHVFRLKKDGLNFLICADCCLFYYKQAWMLFVFFFNG